MVLSGENHNYFTDAERSLFNFIRKVSHHSHLLTEADLECVKKHWSEEAIYTAITVCSLFNFYNRWCDGNGVHPLSPAGYADSGKRLAENGYILPLEPSRAE